MWMLRSEFIFLLNDGYLMTKINLDTFKEIILNNLPAVQMGEFRGLTQHLLVDFLHHLQISIGAPL